MGLENFGQLGLLGDLVRFEDSQGGYGSDWWSDCW